MNNCADCRVKVPGRRFKPGQALAEGRPHVATNILGIDVQSESVEYQSHGSSCSSKKASLSKHETVLERCEFLVHLGDGFHVEGAFAVAEFDAYAEADRHIRLGPNLQDP